MPPRTIVHLDADCFFAAVEQLPTPAAWRVPWPWAAKRGIIASASYEARKFGVFVDADHAGAQALSGSGLFSPATSECYEQFSNWMFGYCYDFTPDVEQTSLTRLLT